MPADDGLRPHDRKSPSPIAPESAERDPKQAIAVLNWRPCHSAAQDVDLLSQHEILQHEIASRPARGAEESD